MLYFWQPTAFGDLMVAKKLLFQFDTDLTPSVFDTVVAYDGGADHITGIAGVNVDNVSAMVDGCIYTRADKKNTAIFVGGSSLEDGEKVFEKLKNRFFGGFRVSTMFDSNGSNTTAAAAVAHITNICETKNKKAVVLGGTGPVGQRASALLAKEGANIVIYANHLLRSVYPNMVSTAESILKNKRAHQIEKRLLSIKNILELIPGTI